MIETEKINNYKMEEFQDKIEKLPEINESLNAETGSFPYISHTKK